VAPQYGVVLNLYFFIGFLLATWTALAVLRHFLVARAPALIGSLLFAFVPYHFYRGEGHLSYSSYYLIPPTVMVLVWVMWGAPLFVVRVGDSARTHLATRKGMVSLLIFALAGFSNYYGFFAALLLAFAGLYGLFADRLLERLKSIVVLGAVLAAGTLASIMPSLLYMMTAGRNPVAAVRPPAESEVYAFHLIQLLLPRFPHRIPYLGHFRAAYSATGLLINENNGGAMGMLGSLGFCFLLAAIFTGLPAFKQARLMWSLALLNLAAFLIGTMGGVGAVFAYLISPEIRAYNRISIYLAFLSITAVVLLLDWLWKLRVPGMAVVLLLVLAGGILEQTSPSDVPRYADVKAVYERDEAFVSGIEASLPKHEMVLQLPNMSFPENGPVNGMLDYAPLRAYLHSRTLRWSYGAMKGRYADAGIRDLSSQLVPGMVQQAALLNFGGIYIDRAGYKDSATAIEHALRAVLDSNPIESADRRLAFYSLISFRRIYRARYSAAELRRMQDVLLHPLVASWAGRCSGLEGKPEQNWRWCGARGELVLENGSDEARDMNLSMWLTGAGPQTVIQISGMGFSDAVPLDAASHTVLARHLVVPPGRHIIQFTSTAPEIYVPGDSRPLAFSVHDFRLTAPGTPDFTWRGGCSPIEGTTELNWHWCSNDGLIEVQNPAANGLPIFLDMTVSSAADAPSRLWIDATGLSESVELNRLETRVFARLELPPGASQIRLKSDGRPVTQPGDSRALVFRVMNFHVWSPLPRLIASN